MHPGLAGDGARAAQAFELPLLQHAQQLRLHVQGQLAHLVQQQRAPAGLLEAPQAQARGAGERAPLVAEQLALHQGGGDGGAVHLHQRRLPPRAQLVDGPGHQLLAGAALAQQQDGRVGPGHPADRIHRGLPGRACPHQRRGRFGRQRRSAVVVLGGQLPFQRRQHPAQAAVQLLLVGQPAEHHHRPDHLPPARERRAGVADREAGAVLAPEHLLGGVHPAVPKRGVDGTARARVAVAVGVRVVQQLVHAPAHQIVQRVAGHRRHRGRHHRRVPAVVDAVHAVLRPLQQPFQLALEGSSRSLSHPDGPQRHRRHAGTRSFSRCLRPSIRWVKRLVPGYAFGRGGRPRGPRAHGL